jgi:hypothetical protein
VRKERIMKASIIFWYSVACWHRADRDRPLHLVRRLGNTGLVNPSWTGFSAQSQLPQQD